MNNIIKGFEWYLPLAFKDCVARCKFEQGDVIYRHQPKGITWGENIRHIDFLIQVKSPARTNSSTGGDLDIFGSNWNSKIVFEKIYPNNSDQNKIIETTQGNFFSYLWKNDETVLTSGISMPPVLTDISAKQIDAEFIKSKIPTGWCGFAMVVDSVSNLIISKRNSINEALASKYNFRTELYDLKEAASLETLDTKSYSGICPTLGIELFLVQSDNLDEIQEVLKTILFKGVKNRFNINIHGQLFKSNMETNINVRSSSSNEVYTVLFKIENNVISINCNCKAGLVKTLCKHRLSLLEGDFSAMLEKSEEATLIDILSKIDKTKISGLYTELNKIELEIKKLDLHRKKLRKEIGLKFSNGF